MHAESYEFARESVFLATQKKNGIYLDAAVTKGIFAHAVPDFTATATHNTAQQAIHSTRNIF